MFTVAYAHNANTNESKAICQQRRGLSRLKPCTTTTKFIN